MPGSIVECYNRTFPLWRWHTFWKENACCSYSLSDLAFKFNISLDYKSLHSALVDSEILCKIFRSLLKVSVDKGNFIGVGYGNLDGNRGSDNGVSSGGRGSGDPTATGTTTATDTTVATTVRAPITTPVPSPVTSVPASLLVAKSHK
eukprot:TRINITY_DN9498_c0_g1_i4.p1 TRINITY_DN9498_c0_g1~~TRINITY_DN9498_c0_g1_i4.p1  ORF type:complete len:147 (-),score=31.84 TRINITY_DN9498_c0_g1_i4:77-517(-)